MMKALLESRYGISADIGTLSEVAALKGVQWAYSAQADGSSYDDLEDFVVQFRRSMKLLPMVLGSMDHDIHWVLAVHRETAGCQQGTKPVLCGRFVMTEMVDIRLQSMDLGMKAFEDALLAIWPCSLTKLLPFSGGILKALDCYPHAQFGGRHTVLQMSDGMFRLIAENAR